MIRSILDQDLYTFTVGQAIMEKYPHVLAKYKFFNRRNVYFNAEFLSRLKHEISLMAELKLQPSEKEFLSSSCPFLTPHYIDHIQNYRFNPEEVLVELNGADLKIEIKGPWARTVFWEVPLLALVSECYFATIDQEWESQGQSAIATNKAIRLGGLNFFDFGTRRRRSYAIHDLVVSSLARTGFLGGTSNVHFAHKYGLKPVGTVSHQWIMGISALESLRHANRYAMRIWSDIFKGNLGIALTDTFGSDAFFRDFDGYLARLYEGVRHDSGDPIEFAEKTIQAYKTLGIDPKTKKIVFSDGITPETAVEINAQLKDRIQVSFGIGTNFTNSFSTSAALNIVIKMTECNGIPVVKLSDAPTKSIGDRDALRVVRWTYNDGKIPLE